MPKPIVYYKVKEDKVALVNNGYFKKMCYNDAFELCVQNIDTILDLVVNMIGSAYYVIIYR